jgi:transposase
MPSPYSEDLRLRVVNAVENGKTMREVATQFQVSSSFVSHVHQRWQHRSCSSKADRWLSASISGTI